MRFLLKSPMREPELIPEAGGETLTLSEKTPEAFAAHVSELGMRRQGRIILRLEGADCGKQAALAARAFFHGAYRISKDALRAPIASVFAARDALCDYGVGELCVDCGREVAADLARGLALARCEGYARALGNLPNNFLRVSDMAAYLTDMAKSRGLTCRVLGDAELRTLGCGGLLAVNRGSSEEANMIVLEHRPNGDSPRTALVGKGVMFDSGGYHLKDIAGMKGMHCDMCGAATVAEVMEFLALTGSPMPAMAVLPLAENVISADAVKMGDVVSTMSGKTVEVYNTDAEGRLILCDALTYAQRQGASRVIDLATLTYGCQSALGDEIGGYFCNDASLAEQFGDVSARAGEGFWRLPLHPRYHDTLKWSESADLANYAPGYGATASTAACFLEEFIDPGIQWLHLDVVGPAVRRAAHTTECKGARGFALATLADMVSL